MSDLAGSRSALLSGTGAFLPARRIASTEYDSQLGHAPGWLEQNCGIIERPVAGPAETQEAMAVSAARDAIADSGIEADRIDLLLFAAAVGRQPIPATAPLIKRELGLQHLGFPAYDINATCLGALTAMDVASLHIAAGRARHVLVVTSEIASRALPWTEQPHTAGLFGDGAAAVMISAGDGGAPGPAFGPFLMETHSEGYDFCALRSGGTRFDYHNQAEAFSANSLFDMDGPALFKLTAAKLPAFLKRFYALAGWARDEIDLVIPHQASPLAITHLVRRCGFDRDIVINQVAHTGNLVAASLPVALHHARTTGRLQPGMKVMLIGTSAGVSFGAAALTV